MRVWGGRDGGNGPVDIPGIGTMGGGKACKGPLENITCACSSTATRLRNSLNSRRPRKVVVAAIKYIINAPRRHEISNHKPNGNDGACQMNNDSCAAVAKAEKFSTTSKASVPPTSTNIKNTI